jgi:peptide/nickel transport system permease protein
MGLSCILLIISLAFFAPLIASNRPILCKHNNQWRAPAVIDTLQQIPGVPLILKLQPPFTRVNFDARNELDPNSFTLWTPIRFAPREIVADVFQPPSRSHWLGTDETGRDLASRMIHAAAVSVKVGFVSMTIAALIGITIGGLAGYLGGWTDSILSRLIEIVVCFPDLFLILSVMVWLEPNITNVMVVIGLTRWTGIARYTRAEFLRLKQQDFILAARAIGARPLSIMFHHLLPNAIVPILVTVTFGIAAAVLIEAGLSWLGLGVQPPNPSWGNILRSAYTNIRVAPHMVYPPCIAIFVSVLAYNLAGDALRNAIDPRTSTNHHDRSPST